MRLVDECHFDLGVSSQFIKASAFPIDKNEEKMATKGNAVSTRLTTGSFSWTLSTKAVKSPD